MSEEFRDPVLEAWALTLRKVDDLMQLGLLEHLKCARVAGFSEDVLVLKIGNKISFDYLAKPSVKSHLLILAKSIFEDCGLRLKDIQIESSIAEF
ncbi:MAG: hypothetical protein NZO16_05335 [Deltaproteobacteria bacterium]|nr:hypothetical protein [Deltaproteobacteria bacterium]